MRSKAKVIELPQRPFYGKSPLRKPKNKDVRTREYLTPEEVEDLMAAAKSAGRHGHRDSTMILIAFRMGYGSPSWSHFAGIKWISNGRHCM